MISEQAAYTGLREIFAEVFARDDLVISGATTAKDISGWDSIRQIEIIMAVGERFGFSLTTREIDSLSSVGELAAIIMRRG